MSDAPWTQHPSIWKTKSSFFSWLRGGIRRSLWNKSPIKLEYIKKHRKRIPNPNPKGKVETVNSIAKRLGVSHSTIENLLEDLENADYY